MGKGGNCHLGPKGTEGGVVDQMQLEDCGISGAPSWEQDAVPGNNQASFFPCSVPPEGMLPWKQLPFTDPL